MADAIMDYADWAGQYVLSQEPVRIPGWVDTLVQGWHLSCHPSLPIIPVVREEEKIAVLLGWPFNREGRLVDKLDITREDDTEAVVYELGGRWLLLMDDRIYLDPVGSQPAVYSPSNRIVASSPGLIDAPLAPELTEAFDVVRRDGWYPFGLTPKQGVHRLLPNHRLDLASFESERHHAPPIPGSVSVSEAAGITLDAIDAAGRAFSDIGLFVGLTAGRDSRMLLAGLRDQIDRCQFWTARSVAKSNSVDTQIARKIARLSGISHTIVERVDTHSTDITAWLDRVGWVRAGAKAQNHKMEETAGGQRVFGHGAIGGVSRGAFVWNYEDPVGPLTLEELLKRVGAPHIPAAEQAAQSW